MCKYRKKANPELVKKNNSEGIPVLEYPTIKSESDLEGDKPNPHYWIQKFKKSEV